MLQKVNKFSLRRFAIFAPDHFGAEGYPPPSKRGFVLKKTKS